MADTLARSCPDLTPDIALARIERDNHVTGRRGGTMAIGDDLKIQLGAIFADAWSSRNGQEVPTAAKVALGKEAVLMTGTVFYADLSQSTAMASGKKPEFAAEIYKSFLHCAAKLVKHFDGSITSYDGDRIMAVFIGDRPNAVPNQK